MLNTVEISVPKHAVKLVWLQLADLTAADIRWNRADATVWRAVGAADSWCGGRGDPGKRGRRFGFGFVASKRRGLWFGNGV